MDLETGFFRWFLVLMALALAGLTAVFVLFVAGVHSVAGGYVFLIDAIVQLGAIWLLGAAVDQHHRRSVHHGGTRGESAAHE